jgi:hypothetical protein
VINGVEGQRLDLSLKSDHDSAVLSIQGLTDESQVVSFPEYATEFGGELPGTQAYAVRVISVLGSDLEVEVGYELGNPPAPTATPAPLAPPDTPVASLGGAVIVQGCRRWAK